MLLSALTLVVGACGPVGATDAVGQPPPLPTDRLSAVVSPVVPQTDLHDASPAAIAEPAFKPRPDPAPAPAPKPLRPAPPTPPPRRTPSDVAPVPAAPRVPPSLDVRPDDRVAIAVSDLAGRLGEDAGIDVLDARQVTWRDGAVGCPAPGLAYSQAEVPGFLVVLRSGDSSYRYHAAGDLMPFLCETPQSPLEGSA